MTDNLSAFLTYFLCTSFQSCSCSHLLTQKIHKLSSRVFDFYPPAPALFSFLLLFLILINFLCCVCSRGDRKMLEIKQRVER